MVRMDECVEALYDKGSMENRRKTLGIVKVMKGAISVSKSRTGECIFRHNKLESKKLERMVKKFRSDKDYTLSRFDTKKKSVVGRWRTILEKQTTCNSTRLLTELLDIEEPEKNQVTKDGNDDDSYFKKFLEMRLQRSEIGANGVGLLHCKRESFDESGDVQKFEENDNPNKEAPVYVTEKNDIRRKYSLTYQNKETGVSKQASTRSHNASTSQPLRLQSLPKLPVLRSLTVTPKTEEGKKEPEGLELTRDPTDWSEWRLKDKDWLLDYIKRQKTRHEDLIMRNALSKIEAEMSGNNTIKRHQIRARLHRAVSLDSSLKLKHAVGPSIERSFVDKGVPNRLQRKSVETKGENFLTARSVTDIDGVLRDHPKKIQKEMTKISVRTLPEPLPVIFENPRRKKKTANLPLITITKA